MTHGAPGPFDLQPAFNYKQIELVKKTFAQRMSVGSEMFVNCKVETWLDYAINAMVVQIDRAVWSHKVGHEDVQWPANWLEAVKERWAPKWFLARYPVEYKRLNLGVYQTYPSYAYAGLGKCVLRTLVEEPVR